jgi:hypothetical protein
MAKLVATAITYAGLGSAHVPPSQAAAEHTAEGAALHA